MATIVLSSEEIPSTSVSLVVESYSVNFIKSESKGITHIDMTCKDIPPAGYKIGCISSG